MALGSDEVKIASDSVLLPSDACSVFPVLVSLEMLLISGELVGEPNVPNVVTVVSLKSASTDADDAEITSLDIFVI